MWSGTVGFSKLLLSFAVALYVGVGFYGTPHVRLRMALLLGFRLVFGVCFGVVCEIYTTRST